MILPHVAQICELSQKFVLQGRAIYHTFNRNKTTYYYLIRWKSQRLLPVRFGVQFTLNQTAEMNYYQVFINNIFNAILLYNP